MKLPSLLFLCLLVTVAGYADDRPPIHLLAGREFLFLDDWAGQDLAFKKQNDTLVAVWRIRGSGIPIISEVEYPVQFLSRSQIVLEVVLSDKSNGRIKVEIRDGPEIRAYLNGVRIPLEEYLGDGGGDPYDRPTIHSLVGREFRIADDLDGQELAFKKQGDSLVPVWRILGASGESIVSEVEYPAELRSAWQVRFEVELRDKSRGKIKVGISSKQGIEAYLNGVRIRLDEKIR